MKEVITRGRSGKMRGWDKEGVDELIGSIRVMLIEVLSLKLCPPRVPPMGDIGSIRVMPEDSPGLLVPEAFISHFALSLSVCLCHVPENLSSLYSLEPPPFHQGTRAHTHLQARQAHTHLQARQAEPVEAVQDARPLQPPQARPADPPPPRPPSRTVPSVRWPCLTAAKWIHNP